jgi:hypothetical protein
MPNSEDWLKDPLLEISGDSYQYRKPKSLNDEENDLWQLFHYTTRFKLNGANFFSTKLIDTALTPEDESRWYLDAFFFELMAAYDTLLQELNTVYAYDLQLEPKAVRWNRIKDKLPDELVKCAEEEREKDWFYEVQWYRNTTTHHYRIPETRSKIWEGDDSNILQIDRDLRYIDKEGKIKTKEISICQDYLRNMAKHISSVWGMMAQEFE